MCLVREQYCTAIVVTGVGRHKRPPSVPLLLHVFGGLEVLYIYCINTECYKIKCCLVDICLYNFKYVISTSEAEIVPMA